jgi:O-antigen/teichoic acid export membrane protein
MVRGLALTSATDTGVKRAGSRRGLLQVAGRLGWGVGDQVVASASNFALSLYVARTFGARTFGAFSIVFVTYTVFLNASRGMATDPMLVRYSGAVGQRWRQATAAATATGLIAGAAAGAVCVVAGILLPSPLGPSFVVLGIMLPGLLLQDSWRFAFFAAGRPAAALLNDVVWSVLLVLALFGLHRSGHGGVVQCLLAFGATASIAAVFGLFQARVLPRPGLAPGWLREHRQLSFRYLVENVTSSEVAQIRSVVLGGVAGLASVGYVRGAELLMGPFLVVLMGISQVAVPEASRVFRRSSGRLIRFCLTLGGIQAAAALAWGLALLVVLPFGPGRLLLKDLWGPTSHLIPAVTLNVVAACFLTALMAGLRAMGVSRRSLRTQLTNSVAYLIGGVLGAVLFGAQGACWGVTLANTFGVFVSGYHLRAALADHLKHPIETA